MSSRWLPRSARALWFAVALAAGAAAVDAADPARPLGLDGAQGGHVLLVRHATAPGFGDPENFRIGDCATQRNLSEEGREQARRLGSALRAAGIVKAQVLTSQWCRCRETADLLGLGKVAELPSLNSVHGRPHRVATQTAALRTFVAELDSDLPVVLVTHQSNIRALTGLAPRSGETIMLRPGGPDGFSVIGRLPPP